MITKHKNTRDSITYITLLLLVVVLSCKFYFTVIIMERFLEVTQRNSVIPSM